MILQIEAEADPERLWQPTQATMNSEVRLELLFIGYLFFEISRPLIFFFLFCFFLNVLLLIVSNFPEQESVSKAI